MQPRVSSIFGSYDLFAKAFPGIVFFSLSVSLLPVPEVSQNIQSNGILLAVIALSVIIFGFVSGQALHAIAVRIEKIAFRTAKSYIFYRTTIYVLIKSMFGEIKYRILHILQESEKDEKGTDEEVTPQEDNDTDNGISLKEAYIGDKKDRSDEFYGNTKEFLREWIVLLIYTILSLSPVFLVVFYIWIGELATAAFTIGFIMFPPRNAKIWFRETLYPHRELFDDKISENGHSVKKFKSYIQELYDVKPNECSEFTYKIVMSYYERITVGRTRQFQATFSFCRSMWVTLLLFSTIYLFISSPTLSELLPLIDYETVFNWSYTPIIELLLPNQTILNAVGFVMFLSVILFMEGERQNKKLFVEYIFIDLLTISEKELPEDIQAES